MNKLVAAALLAGMLSPAMAADSTSAWSVYGSIGTQGVGVGTGLQLSPRWALRGQLDGLSYSRDFRAGSIDYSGRLQLRSLSALADFHPAAGALRLTAGVVLSDSRLEGDGTLAAGGQLRVAGRTYSLPAGEGLRGDIRFASVAPYLGVGFGRPVSSERGWGVFGDVGAFYANPKASLVASPLLQAAAAGRADLEAERAELQKKADTLAWYPVVRLGLRYTF